MRFQPFDVPLLLSRRLRSGNRGLRSGVVPGCPLLALSSRHWPRPRTARAANVGGAALVWPSRRSRTVVAPPLAQQAPHAPRVPHALPAGPVRERAALPAARVTSPGGNRAREAAALVGSVHFMTSLEWRLSSARTDPALRRARARTEVMGAATPLLAASAELRLAPRRSPATEVRQPPVLRASTPHGDLAGAAPPHVDRGASSAPGFAMIGTVDRTRTPDRAAPRNPAQSLPEPVAAMAARRAAPVIGGVAAPEPARPPLPPLRERRPAGATPARGELSRLVQAEVARHLEQMPAAPPAARAAPSPTPVHESNAALADDTVAMDRLVTVIVRRLQGLAREERFRAGRIR